MIIGIAGHPASGKDTIAKHLATKGYINISGGDILREQLHKRGLPTDRATVHDFVAQKRRELGPDYLAKESLKRIGAGQNTIINGFRHPAEVEVFRDQQKDRFFLIAVDAPIETRYKRARERNRIGDDLIFENFQKQEEVERSGTEHKVDDVMKMADILISNDGSENDLETKVDAILTQLQDRKV